MSLASGSDVPQSDASSSELRPCCKSVPSLTFKVLYDCGLCQKVAVAKDMNAEIERLADLPNLDGSSDQSNGSCDDVPSHAIFEMEQKIWKLEKQYPTYPKKYFRAQAGTRTTALPRTGSLLKHEVREEDVVLAPTEPTRVATDDGWAESESEVLTVDEGEEYPLIGEDAVDHEEEYDWATEVHEGHDWTETSWEQPAQSTAIDYGSEESSMDLQILPGLQNITNRVSFVAPGEPTSFIAGEVRCNERCDAPTVERSERQDTATINTRLTTRQSPSDITLNDDTATTIQNWFQQYRPNCVIAQTCSAESDQNHETRERLLLYNHRCSWFRMGFDGASD